MTITGRTSAPSRINGIVGLQERVGRHLGMSAWQTVEEYSAIQDPVVAVDHDADPSKNDGFLTASLAAALLQKVCQVDGFGAVVNYGLGHLRYPSPTAVSTRLRLHVVLTDVLLLTAVTAQAVYHLEFEIEGESKRACVCDLTLRYEARSGRQTSSGQGN